MRRRFLQFGSLVVLLACVGQASWAQDGERLREWRARQEARREAAAEKRANGGGAGKGQPNERAMEGLPPKWVDRVRDMPPEQQQQFLENNAQFRQLPPARQEQIRQNLDKWNHLSPEEKEAARGREILLEQMSPEQREYVRGTLLPKWQALPQPRRQAINQRLAMLRNMSPATQQAALNDPKFVQGLSPDEQSMLRDLNSLRNPAVPAQQAPPPQ
jgi:Protein of unknown function (DUF3106)